MGFVETLLLLQVSFDAAGVVLSAGKCTVNPATGGYDGLVVVACDTDAEDGDENTDELDGGICVPCHRCCG